jgi:hypothetical protein
MHVDAAPAESIGPPSFDHVPVGDEPLVGRDRRGREW